MREISVSINQSEGVGPFQIFSEPFFLHYIIASFLRSILGDWKCVCTSINFGI
jgi:hypothetical protein